MISFDGGLHFVSLEASFSKTGPVHESEKLEDGVGAMDETGDVAGVGCTAWINGLFRPSTGFCHQRSTFRR